MTFMLPLQPWFAYAPYYNLSHWWGHNYLQCGLNLILVWNFTNLLAFLSILPCFRYTMTNDYCTKENKKQAILKNKFMPQHHNSPWSSLTIISHLHTDLKSVFHSFGLTLYDASCSCIVLIVSWYCWFTSNARELED